MKKLLAIFLVAVLLLSLAACGGPASQSSSSEESVVSESKSEESQSEESETELGRWDALVTTDEPVDLLVYWELAPTVNTEPTEEAPLVKTVGTQLMATWLADKPNVSVTWSREFEQDSEWITINYTANQGPDIFTIWGGRDYSDNGWLVDLDEIIMSPNYYEAGSPVWYDTFPEYLFAPGETTRSNYDTITGVPVTLSTGSATAIGYNTELCEELGFEPTTDFDRLIEMCLYVRENTDYVPMMPFNGEISPTMTAWVAQFSLMPVYAQSVSLDVADYDKDGAMSAAEMYRACWEGGFYMQNHPAMQELYDEEFRYFWSVYEEGAMDIDYTGAWQSGNVVFRDVGLFEVPALRSDTKVSFDWDIYPPPVKQNSEYTTPIEWTTGPYNPAVAGVYNIIKPELQDRPDYYADYLVDWLKFMTCSENLSMQVEEAQGACLGAVKGCTVPSALGDWFENEFPKLPAQNRLARPALTEATANEFAGLLNEYLYKLIDRQEFIDRHDELMYRSIQAYVTEQGEDLDTSEWGDLVAPPIVADAQ